MVYLSDPALATLLTPSRDAKANVQTFSAARNRIVILPKNIDVHVCQVIIFIGR